MYLCFIFGFMKRYLPVFLSIILVISGLHLSVISHYCGGKRVQTEVSFDPHAASCGMENDQSEAKRETALHAPDCCSNRAAIYATDDFYQFSSCAFKPVKTTVQTVFLAPTNTGNSFYHSHLLRYTQIHPPGFIPLGITPETLCVFRI